MTDQPTPRPAALDGLLGYVAANLPAEDNRPTSELLAEIDRLRAQLAEQQAENGKLIRWHREDETALNAMRDTIVRLRGELAEATAAVPAAAETGE